MSYLIGSAPTSPTGTLSTGIDADDTTIVLTGAYAEIPEPSGGDVAPLLIHDADDPTIYEWVHVTARTADTCTITRAREGTTALEWTAGAEVEHGLPPGAFTQQAAGFVGPRKLGTGATDAAAGDDARLSDARTPTAHAASHSVGGTDLVSGLKIMDATYGVHEYFLVDAEVYVIPDDCYLIYVAMVGPGGGAGGAQGAASQAAAGAGGASGEYSEFWMDVEPGWKLTATVPDGGAGGSSSGGNGSTPLATALAVTDADDNPVGNYEASGGRYGNGMTAGTANGFSAGGLPLYSGLFAWSSGDPGHMGVRLGTTTGTLIAGAGGSGPLGQGGGSRTIAGIGLAASGYGAGGGGGLAIGSTGRAGGAGAPGAIRITLFS